MPEETEPGKFGEKLLSKIANKFQIVQGLIFIKNQDNEKFSIKSTYAYYSDEMPEDFTFGEGLTGQVAKNKKPLNIKEIPEGYIKILSGLGEGVPSNLLIFPVIDKNNEVIGIVELASFINFEKGMEDQFIEFFKSISEKFITAQKQ